jgi:flagellar biosynthesis protein
LSEAKPQGPDPLTDANAPRDRKVAVALHYDPIAAATPRVVATGRGALAEQILSIAFAAGVKVREDADLAEILAKVDLDSEIPIEALAAVAEILAYVYRLNATPVPALPPAESGG